MLLLNDVCAKQSIMQSCLYCTSSQEYEVFQMHVYVGHYTWVEPTRHSLIRMLKCICPELLYMPQAETHGMHINPV